VEAKGTRRFQRKATSLYAWSLHIFVETRIRFAAASYFFARRKIWRDEINPKVQILCILQDVSTHVWIRTAD